MIPFFKYNGCGNDFILVDNRKQFWPLINPGKVKELCQRKTGIGADGLILLELSQRADAKMRIFNSDGSEAEMCGNGIRCLLKFMHDLGFDKKKMYRIETMHSVLEGQLNDQGATIAMGIPTKIDWDIPYQAFTLHQIHTGVPHVVAFVDKVEEIDVFRLGRAIRTDARFAPQGTNVNFVEVLAPNQLRVRTYERGVEEETLACGTGITASALAYGHLKQNRGPVQVVTGTGETIQIDFHYESGRFKDVTMTGPAKQVFHGFLAKNECVA